MTKICVASLTIPHLPYLIVRGRISSTVGYNFIAHFRYHVRMDGHEICDECQSACCLSDCLLSSKNDKKAIFTVSLAANNMLKSWSRIRVGSVFNNE